MTSYYKVFKVTNDDIEIQLSSGGAWLPSFISLVNDDRRIPLQVTSIDTGAGEISLPELITIGYIIKDKDGAVCDDSCEFAFDGVCDDSSVSNSYTSFIYDSSDINNNGDYYAQAMLIRLHLAWKEPIVRIVEELIK
eukprot:CAMPEP_0196767892 /NCGR_PEP_ID=MMETSP1095-20130614/42084_1 /TAXON_ID=96789 ORGANISM="Chromulina nebulosa, Strain UTEXLB2642" /NCGR_SAMPLE_ID=MMETSP1095 /ASSEMBLY_ACC=CAM_ASM_000446 /LENGTH=136 /DNA_ID=CAMNT_0042136687 /DNA_START=1538 /DNA_END=1949 /DNA_ORIENTATION=-